MVLSARALTRVRGACGFTKALGVVMVVESIVSSCAVAAPATVCAYEDLEIASRRGFYSFSEERKRDCAIARVNGERIVKNDDRLRERGAHGVANDLRVGVDPSNARGVVFGSER